MNKLLKNSLAKGNITIDHRDMEVRSDNCKQNLFTENNSIKYGYTLLEVITKIIIQSNSHL